MDCNTCGAKCCKILKEVWVTDEDIERISSRTGLKLEEFAVFDRKVYILIRKNDSCLFLENDKCKIYDFKPKVCNEFICDKDEAFLRRVKLWQNM